MRTKSIMFPNTRDEMESLFDKLQRALINYALNSGGMVIKDTSETEPKTASDVYYLIDGSPHLLEDGDLGDPEGTVVEDTVNVYVYTVNAAGDVANYMGTAGASLGAVVFPEIPDGEVAIGFIVVSPSEGDFIGGTTALDENSSVIPATVYINSVGPFLPELKEL